MEVPTGHPSCALTWEISLTHAWCCSPNVAHVSLCPLVSLAERTSPGHASIALRASWVPWRQPGSVTHHRNHH